MKTQSQTQFMSFEYIDVIVKFSNTSTRMVIIYRPPPSKKNQLNNALFFEEFSKLMEQLIISPGNLLTVGDFNYHVDNTTNPETIKFNKILELFNLQQHVKGSVACWQGGPGGHGPSRILGGAKPVKRAAKGF